ncbi:MAG: hypothetical protein KL863_27175 [Rhizobium sp.]|nr:hypothetical protein [Rhizobium sp.]
MAIDSASLERRIVELGEVADLAGQGRLPWLDFTRALVDVVPGSLGSLTVSHSDASRTFLAPVGYEPEVLQSYSEHFAALNPWNDFWAKAAPGRVQISSHAAPSLRYRKTEFYEDWLMRLDGRADGIGIKMPTTDGDVLPSFCICPTRDWRRPRQSIDTS